MPAEDGVRDSCVLGRVSGAVSVGKNDVDDLDWQTEERGRRAR